MNITITDHWEHFVEWAVKSGRYGSPGEVVLEGLRLVEHRDAKLQSLRDTLDASIEAGGCYTAEDLETVLAEVREELRQQGI